MNFWSNIACVFYMLQVAHVVDTTHTSKACFGTPGLSCTEHELSCNNTQTIHIEDAYYTSNTECTKVGLSDCNTVKPNNVTESARHSSFNTTEMSSLKNNCSAKCTYRAPRRSGDIAFSVVRYECNEVVGGVVITILVLIVIILILVWYLRKRRRKTNQSGKENTQSKVRKTDITYSTAGNIPQSHYHEIDDLKTKSRSSDYDYATADGVATALNKNTYFTIEPATKPTTNQNSSTSTTEDDYDHIGDKLPALTSDYDTTASVAKSARTGAHSRIDDYGYNLLHEGKSNKTVQNDYDTAASANKAVAQLGRIDEKTAEDDYDHFPGTNDNSETLSSSHAGKVRDRSDDYTFAGPMQ